MIIVSPLTVPEKTAGTLFGKRPRRMGPNASRVCVPRQLKRPRLSMVNGPAIVPLAQSYSIVAELDPTSIAICIPPHGPAGKREVLRLPDAELDAE